MAGSFSWYQSLFGQPQTPPAHDDFGQILDTDGTRRTTIFLLGPASQIVAKNVDTDHEELVDEAAVDELHTRTQALRPVGKPTVARDEPDDWLGVI